MSTEPIEKLVPSPVICKAVFDADPEAFSKSVFVWSYSCDKRILDPFVELRDMIDYCRRDITVNAPPVYPAPTLQEVQYEIGKLPNVSICRASVIRGEWRVSAQNERGNCSFPLYLEDAPATAALRLWLHIRKGL